MTIKYVKICINKFTFMFISNIIIHKNKDNRERKENNKGYSIKNASLFRKDIL